MNDVLKKEIEKNLQTMLENIQVPKSRYEAAESSYKAVGAWLDRKESGLNQYNPEIYCQGSFSLGTAIRPLNENDEYDVDIVAKFDLRKSEITQKDFKERIGVELKEYHRIQGFINDLKEGKRCWTLNYADEAKFHIDILPAIPNLNALGEKLKMEFSMPDASLRFHSENAIDITDNTSTNYC